MSEASSIVWISDLSVARAADSVELDELEELESRSNPSYLSRPRPYWLEVVVAAVEVRAVAEDDVEWCA